jgi:hypothetical protein
MNVSGQDANDLLRLLECWLPLAQELNEAQGWGDDAQALEALIRAATPALAGAPSPAAARAILAVYHTVLRVTRP